MNAEVMGIPEVAEYMGISTRTVFRLIQDKKIPAKKLGGRWYVPRAGLRKLLGVPEEKTVQQAAAPQVAPQDARPELLLRAGLVNALRSAPSIGRHRRTLTVARACANSALNQ